MVLLLSVPAGRSTRRSNSKWVDPEPEKGLIELEFDDDLLRFWWKNRVTGAKEDELIIFPSEATFEKVQQDPSGRTHALRFHTGSTLNFYWFQRASSEGDLRAMVDINALIEDPTYQVGSAPLPEVSAPSGPTADAERSWPPTPGAPKLSHPVPGPPSASSAAAGTSAAGSSAASASGNAQTDMARMLMEWAQQGGLGATQEDARLTDVLSPVNMATLLSSRPNLVSTIKPLLPAQLNLPPDPTVQDLLPILSAPQFTDAIASLDNALRSGGLPGGMMRELGLPESAGTGVKEFLEALKGLKSDDSMEQD